MKLIGRIWLPIHLEILRALREVYLSGGERSPETVIERVERTVHQAMWPMHDLAYSPRRFRYSDFGQAVNETER